MSLYRAYFVPGALDPTGTTLEVVDSGDKSTFKNLLNALCPEGGFYFLPWSNKVRTKFGFCMRKTTCISANRAGATFVTIGPLVATAKHKVSCNCICDAIKSSRTITLQDIPNRPFGSAAVPRKPKLPSGWWRTPKSMPPLKNTFLDHVEIDSNSSAITEGVPGIRDSKPPGKGRVRQPLWLILGHELCGHAVPNLEHPTDGTARTSTDPVIVIENQIRSEHSTQGDNLGMRGKDLVPKKLW